MTLLPQYRCQDYTVGWLCALPVPELLAAKTMLDLCHDAPYAFDNGYDENFYYFGEINKHKVVLSSMPSASPGTMSAQKLIQPLRQSFPSMTVHLFVGIAGGIPRLYRPKDPMEDIHLGDVVVGWPQKTGSPAVIQHDLVRDYGPGKDPELLNRLDKPARRLLNALVPMETDRDANETKFHDHLSRLSHLPKFAHPGIDADLLFEVDCSHVGPADKGCHRCHGIVERPSRTTEQPQFHQGTILSSNTLLQDACKRDDLSKTYHDAMCVEMEAAGVIDETHCLVIRGISDYADSHRQSLNWHHYAAATAAAFAREILYTIRSSTVQIMKLENEDNRARVLKILKEGQSFMTSFQSSSFAPDLYSALRCYQHAADIIQTSGISDPALYLKAAFRLTIVEMDLTYDKETSLDERIAHHRQAEEQISIALRAAHILGKTIAQIRVEQAIIKGRKAELEEKRGTHVTETRRVKEEALSDLEIAMKDLETSDRDKSAQYAERTTLWRRRLSRGG